MLEKDVLHENPLSEEALLASLRSITGIVGSPSSKYKDSIFRMLVKDKRVALEIYNAMNDSYYDNPEEIIITTLENAVYMGIKNDVSFLIDSRLVLWEHQSTKNPNMPLRDLFYVACIYAALIGKKNIYKGSLIPIPAPKFVVLYNGREEMPERWQMRLSDAFIKSDGDISLELKVDAININSGYNEGLMQKSPTLFQYATFVDTVRNYEKSYDFDVAMELAIDECIQKDILKEFLEKNRAEVLKMWLFEYDQEEHMRQLKEESMEDGFLRGQEKGREEGLEEGRAEGRAEGREEGRLGMIRLMLSNGKTLDEIASFCNIPLEELKEEVK